MDIFDTNDPSREGRHGQSRHRRPGPSLLDLRLGCRLLALGTDSAVDSHRRVYARPRHGLSRRRSLKACRASTGGLSSTRGLSSGATLKALKVRRLRPRAVAAVTHVGATSRRPDTHMHPTSRRRARPVLAQSHMPQPGPCPRLCAGESGGPEPCLAGLGRVWRAWAVSGGPEPWVRLGPASPSPH